MNLIFTGAVPGKIKLKRPQESTPFSPLRDG